MKNVSVKLKSALIAIVLVLGMSVFFFAKPAGAANISTSNRNLAALIAVDNITGDDGLGGGDDDLADLIVLNGLFDGTSGTSGLAGLIAVDNITGDDGIGGGDSDLADLIVLNGLFDSVSGGTDDLAALIAVDNITGDGGGDNDLADLIVLNNLFDP